MDWLPGLILPNVVIAGAALLQAATGIGFAMIAVPFLGLLDLAWLPGPMLQANIFLSVVMALRDRAALEPVEAPPLIAGLALGTVLGAGVLTQMAAQALGTVIGAVICVAVVLSLATPRFALTRRAVLIGGTAGGATGVVAAMHGPPLILLYQHEPPAKIRATMASVFVVGSLMALLTLWLADLYGPMQMRAGLALLPGLAVGYGAGRWLAGRLSPVMARFGMLAISGTGGAALLLKSL